MPYIPHIVRSYRGHHIVWFQNSKQFVLLKQPAFDIFQMKIRDKGINKIILHLEKKFGIDTSSGSILTNEILQGIERYNTIEVSDAIRTEYLNDQLTSKKHYPQRKYGLGNWVVSIAYENQIFENYIHPLISHLELGPETQQDFDFEIISNKSNIILKRESRILGAYGIEETNLLKGKIFFEMANIIHGITENEWLMTVHASAITNEKKTILFSAAPGGGKTTIAALLLRNGFRLVSDDFVPVDRLLMAYSFPVALSVKEGSLQTLLPYYPELSEKPSFDVSPEKRVRYVSELINLKKQTDKFPINEVVFVQYDKNIPCRMKRLNRTKGLMKFLEQTYVTPEPACVEILLNWAFKANFYELIYSDNLKAISKASKLFEYE